MKYLENLRLQKTLPAFRERFRHTLEGYWCNPDCVPFGHSYEFRGDGTGLMVEYSGLGAEERAFHWRSVGDWIIEFEFDEYIGPGEGEQWEQVSYDFVIADAGYFMAIVLCSKANAEKFSPKVNHSIDALDFYLCDGPLLHREFLA